MSSNRRPAGMNLTVLTIQRILPVDSGRFQSSQMQLFISAEEFGSTEDRGASEPVVFPSGGNIAILLPRDSRTRHLGLCESARVCFSER